MKYKLTSNKKEVYGKTFYQIESLINFGNVKIGELGGYIEKEANLSQEGDAWVYGDAEVFGDAWVYGDAEVFGDAWVYGDALVSGNAKVYDNARIYGNAVVYDNARIYGNAVVYGNARIYGNAVVYGNARIYGNAVVYGNAKVSGDAEVFGNARVSGDAWVCGNAKVYGDAEINRDNDIIWFSHFGSCTRTTTIFKTKDNGLKVNCGCFNGTLLEFKKQIKKTHGDNKFAKEYLAICNVAEIHFKKELEEV